MKLKIFSRRPKPHAKRKNKRHIITFKGSEGKLWRRIAIAAGMLVLLVILISTMHVEPSLLSSAEIATVYDRGVLRVGVRNDLPGLAYEGEGLEYELGQMLAQRIMSANSNWNGNNDPAEFIEVNSMTTSAHLNDNTIDVALATMSKDAVTRYAYSDAYYRDPCYLLVRQGDEGRSITNINIGLIQSATTSSILVSTSSMTVVLNTYIEAHSDDNIKKVGFASYDELFAALSSGKVDAVLLSETNIERFDALSDFFLHSAEMGYIDYAIACLSSSPALVQIANIMLNEMKADGSLEALYQKYGLTYRLGS